MNSLGKARFLLEPPKGLFDRFEGGRKELVILEEGGTIWAVSDIATASKSSPGYSC